MPSFANPLRPKLLAFLIYLELSLCLFGLRVLVSPATSYVGFPQDPSQVIWFLAWWPHALLHAQNPLMTRALWAPAGFNLTWALSMPAVSVLAAPLTLSFGPVVSYNVLTLLAPAVSAWTAYILCSAIVTGAFWPALMGGYLYGFSTYQLAHVLSGHLSLSLIFIPPLCLCLLLLQLHGELSSGKFTLGIALLLILQFLTSPEIFATMTVFGGIALLIAALMMPELRARLYHNTLLLGCAYAMTAIVVSPFLYYFLFVHGVSREPIYPPALFSTDLLGVIIPGPLTLVSAAAREVPSAWENGAYLGPALVTLIVWFALRSWHQGAAKLLLIMLGVVYLASLGPTLHVADHPTISLPWGLVTSYLPLLNIALPVRFMMFAWLITALIAAMWLARQDIATPAKIALALLSVVSLFPDPLFLWHAQTQIKMPQFFSRGLYRHYLRPDENVLILPYGKNGDSMLWQAHTSMDFRMAEGWTGLVPPEFLRWPILNTFYSGNLMPDWQTQFKAFLAAHDVEAVVISDRAGDFSQRLLADALSAALREFTSARSANGPWEELLSTLGVQPIRVGGITLYKVPAQVITENRGANLAELETTADAAWFSMLLAAGEKYLSSGEKLEQLTPARARELGLLPPALWPHYLYVASEGKRTGLEMVCGSVHGLTIWWVLACLAHMRRPTR